MTAMEFLSKVKVDGKPVGEVVQMQIDPLQVTLVYNVPRDGKEPARRVLTVETEAVTIG